MVHGIANARQLLGVDERAEVLRYAVDRIGDATTAYTPQSNPFRRLERTSLRSRISDCDVIARRCPLSPLAEHLLRQQRHDTFD